MKPILLLFLLPLIAAAQITTYPNASASGNATTVNGGSVPASQPCVGTNSGSQFIAGTCGTPTLTNTHFFVGNASNVATDVVMSKDATLANTGAVTVIGLNGTLLGGLGTGLLKNTTATGVPSIAGTSDILSLFSGTCDSTTLLGGDGACKAVSSAFSVITSGTNTNALVMGTGGSLGVSGTGTIAATSVTGLTLANTLTTSGNFALTLTSTATTNATLPAGSTTLAQLGANTFTASQTIASGQQLILPAGTTANSALVGGGNQTGFSFPNSTSIFVNHGGANTGQLNSNIWISPGTIAIGCSSSACVGAVRSGAIFKIRLGDNSADAAVTALTAQIHIYTVATLPTCNAGAEGTMAGVSDSLAPTFLATLVGGGAVHSPAYCNGTNWVAN